MSPGAQTPVHTHPGPELVYAQEIDGLAQGVSRSFFGRFCGGPTAETRTMSGLAGPEGIEPPTRGLGVPCSVH